MGLSDPEHWTGDCVTVHKNRYIYIRHSRFPLPEIYSSLSEAFHKAYANETEVPGVEAVSHLVGLKYAGLQSFPTPVIWEVG